MKPKFFCTHHWHQCGPTGKTHVCGDLAEWTFRCCRCRGEATSTLKWVVSGRNGPVSDRTAQEAQI